MDAWNLIEPTSLDARSTHGIRSRLHAHDIHRGDVDALLADEDAHDQTCIAKSPLYEK